MEAKVLSWRRAELVRAIGGDYLREIELLARGDADLHDIVSTFERGCTPRMLVLIFG